MTPLDRLLDQLRSMTGEDRAKLDASVEDSVGTAEEVAWRYEGPDPFGFAWEWAEPPSPPEGS